VAAVAVAAGTGFAAHGLWPGAASPASAGVAVPVATATVARTDLSARQTAPGTLGFRGSYQVVNELPAGVLTWLPAAGRVVRRGQVLYRLADQPVFLLYGPVPAWRAFGPGMGAGPDVRELQRNLIALGFDPGHQITADGIFGWATMAAVGRWQQAHGMTVTGTIPLGQVAFLPGPLRVTGAGTASPADPGPPAGGPGPAAVGSPVSVGTTVLTGTSDTPSVLVSLAVGGPAVRPGDPVSVTLPDGTTTVPGRVAWVGRVASTPSATAQAAGGSPGATIPVLVTIGRPGIPGDLDQAPVQVAITQTEHRNVLAVPVTALLARSSGGYAVRTTGRAGHLIPVTTGLFDDASGLVEVTGPGLAAGLTVQEAQG
jgi:peptidoglycan hydrolase-like protein with peptidoglycan-binding domain